MGYQDIEAVPLLKNPEHAKQNGCSHRSSKNVGIWASVILFSFAVFAFTYSLQGKQSTSPKEILHFQSKSLSTKQIAEEDLLRFESQSFPPLRLKVSNEYGSVQSLEYYKWNHLAEPYKTSTLRINSPLSDTKYTWTIFENDDSSLLLDYSEKNDQASEISAIFTRPGKLYTVKVVEEGGANRSFEFEVICKYVRREIRDLTDEDRETFLNALHTFYTIPLEEGRSKYGERFINSKKLTLKHVQQYATPDGSFCSPWHHGMTFMNGHMAFALWTEQALQLIDPTIALPYWDYVKDSEEYGNGFEESEIFTDDYMGVYMSYPFKSSGRWEDLSVSTVESESDKYHIRWNSYGVVTDWYNNNNETVLTRSNLMCGLKMSLVTMPDCRDLHDVLKSFSLESAYNEFELEIHDGGLHSLLGGFFNCAENYHEIFDQWPGNDTQSYYFRYYMESFLVNAQSKWDNAYFRGYYNGSAPTTCNATTPFEECRYSCSAFESVDDLTDAEVYDYLENMDYLASFSEYLTTANTTSGNYSFETSTSYVFQHVDHETDLQLKRHLLKLYCNPARMTQFSSPLGSPDDPLFTLVHSYFSIYWDYLLLTKGPDYQLEWTDETTCKGHSIHDVMPQEWFGFLREAQNKEHDLTYTHFDLIKIFHPNNENLPYLHAKFDWDYCRTTDLTDLVEKPKMYKGQKNNTYSVP
mmetsp:Transcript_13049/g.16736  ORF Transcript_13049/g.16736 Transcript_13049/m.16736 type:complete len:694 (+) Transcript_13049:149-2230(+)